MNEKLSICIVVYKSYSDVMDAIESIEKWTSDSIPKQIYIVDNSPSGIAGMDIFKKDINKFPDVKYYYTGQNLGFGKGHNFILDNLDSTYHAIVNPDIVLAEDSFQKIIEYMNAREDVGAVIPNITDMHGNQQDVYREELTVFDMFARMFCKNLFPKRMAKHSMQYMDFSKEFQVPFGQGSFIVVRTQLFKELQGFDENYFMYVEDADFCRRINQTSKLMYYPGTNVVHKWEKGSHRNLKLLKYHIQSMIRYFNKWGYKWY